ncbi:hypothetical protein J6590_003254 [Homalodisca vitripennis]|nr:hypothetical protein J6590_003254 [Homalodisca vitripennis]
MKYVSAGRSNMPVVERTPDNERTLLGGNTSGQKLIDLPFKMSPAISTDFGGIRLHPALLAEKHPISRSEHYVSATRSNMPVVERTPDNERTLLGGNISGQKLVDLPFSRGDA